VDPRDRHECFRAEHIPDVGAQQRLDDRLEELDLEQHAGKLVPQRREYRGQDQLDEQQRHRQNRRGRGGFAHRFDQQSPIHGLWGSCS
jgi:hypothetical protein